MATKINPRALGQFCLNLADLLEDPEKQQELKQRARRAAHSAAHRGVDRLDVPPEVRELLRGALDPDPDADPS
jgi:hypothetical protein